MENLIKCIGYVGKVEAPPRAKRIYVPPKVVWRPINNKKSYNQQEYEYEEGVDELDDTDLDLDINEYNDNDLNPRVIDEMEP